MHSPWPSTRCVARAGSCRRESTPTQVSPAGSRTSWWIAYRRAAFPRPQSDEASYTSSSVQLPDAGNTGNPE